MILFVDPKGQIAGLRREIGAGAVATAFELRP
jgi:hypothetical protein